MAKTKRARPSRAMRKARTASRPHPVPSAPLGVWLPGVDTEITLSPTENDPMGGVQAWSDRFQGVLRRTGPQLRDIVRTHIAARTSWTIEALDQVLERAQGLYLGQHGWPALRDAVRVGAYIDWFPTARALQRRLVLHVGPTNSGKTHAALDQLAQEGGVYLAPLRLMALEGQEKLQERGCLCSLRTGEERVDQVGARHTASTIEMMNTTHPVAVAVIDEVQLLDDPDRGWAWTQAIVGAPARTVIMTGSPDAIPAVKRLAKALNEPIEIRRFVRKTPLCALKNPVSLAQVKPKDAIVAFSRREVLRLRDVLTARGHQVACIYGALGPEVRRNEARRFRDGMADIVVATDAIGMGLNLPVDRVLFSALEKFDGIDQCALSENTIRQVAGRAGRYGLSAQGETGVLLGAGNPLVIQAALDAQPIPPQDHRVYAQAPWGVVEQVAKAMQSNHLGDVLHQAHRVLLDGHPDFQAPCLDDALALANILYPTRLPLEVQYGYMGCPLDLRTVAMVEDIKGWAKIHAAGGEVFPPSEPVDPTPVTNAALQAMESLAKRLTVYSWLAMRWPTVYPHNTLARQRRQGVHTAIEWGLRHGATAPGQKSAWDR